VVEVMALEMFWELVIEVEMKEDFGEG